MKYNVIQSESFNNTFDEVYQYIKYVLKAPKAAEALRKKIIEGAINLQTMPEAYPKLEGIKYKNKPIRFYNVKNFTVLFTVNKNTVIMHNIVYSKSDIKNNLNKK